MISLDDARWSNMTGGYRMPLDPRPLIKRLDTDADTTAVWQDLWDELHHQGDVGEASFAAVPFLVESYRKQRVLDGNTFAIVAIIELARKEGKNPDVPQWIAEDYFQATGAWQRSALQWYCSPKARRKFAPYSASLRSVRVSERTGSSS